MSERALHFTFRDVRHCPSALPQPRAHCRNTKDEYPVKKKIISAAAALAVAASVTLTCTPAHAADGGSDNLNGALFMPVMVGGNATILHETTRGVKLFACRVKGRPRNEREIVYGVDARGYKPAKYKAFKNYAYFGQETGTRIHPVGNNGTLYFHAGRGTDDVAANTVAGQNWKIRTYVETGYGNSTLSKWYSYASLRPCNLYIANT